MPASWSAVVAIAIFLSKKAGVAMDRIVVVLGAVMIGMVTWAAVTTNPPYGEALKQVVLPDTVDFLVITTPSAARSAATSPTPVRTGSLTRASPAPTTSA